MSYKRTRQLAGKVRNKALPHSLAMPAPPVTALYNVMGKKGQAHLLSFVESCSGPCNEPVWTVQCKIAGEVKGVGVARQKAAAKSAAAQQALDAIPT